MMIQYNLRRGTCTLYVLAKHRTVAHALTLILLFLHPLPRQSWTAANPYRKKPTKIQSAGQTTKQTLSDPYIVPRRTRMQPAPSAVRPDTTPSSGLLMEISGGLDFGVAEGLWSPSRCNFLVAVASRSFMGIVPTTPPPFQSLDSQGVDRRPLACRNPAPLDFH